MSDSEVPVWNKSCYNYFHHTNCETVITSHSIIRLTATSYKHNKTYFYNIS